VGKALQAEETGCANPKSLGLPHSQEWSGTQGALTGTWTDRMRDETIKGGVCCSGEEMPAR